MDITSITGILLGGGAGGVVGAISGLAQMWLGNIKERNADLAKIEAARIQNEHNLALEDKKLLYLKAEAEHAIQLAAVRKDEVLGVKEFDALSASYIADSADAPVELTKAYPFLMTMAYLIRTVTRPLLTWYLSILYAIFAGYISYYIFNHIPTMLADPTFLKNSFTEIVAVFGFAFTSTISWWFVSRYNPTQK